MTRKTLKYLDDRIEELNRVSHEQGMNKDLHFGRYSRNGYHGVIITGGPRLGTGVSDVGPVGSTGQVCAQVEFMLDALYQSKGETERINR